MDDKQPKYTNIKLDAVEGDFQVTEYPNNMIISYSPTKSKVEGEGDRIWKLNGHHELFFADDKCRTLKYALDTRISMPGTGNESGPIIEDAPDPLPHVIHNHIDDILNKVEGLGRRKILISEFLRARVEENPEYDPWPKTQTPRG